MAGQLESLRAIEKVLDKYDFGEGSRVFATSQKYFMLHLLNFLSSELARNLGLALACVFLVTMFMLASLIASLLVVLMVAVSMVIACGILVRATNTN